MPRRSTVRSTMVCGFTQVMRKGGCRIRRAHLETLTALVNRWTPEHLHDEPLPQELAQIQTRTREYFRRLFG